MLDPEQHGHDVGELGLVPPLLSSLLEGGLLLIDLMELLNESLCS